ncbi:MAG TPA: helix-turn-helix domain-containing protein [Galbitalea sp.]
MVEPSFHVTDPAMLRAMAHPLRQRIIWELSVRTYGRAADLAGILGEPANSVSYHLRALAKVDVVEEAPEFARDSRDRVWRLAHPEGFYAPAGSAAADILIEEQLGWIREFLSETLERQPGAAHGEYLGAALLTETEAKGMFQEIAEILERWRTHGAEAATADPDNAERIFHRMVFLLGNR